MFLYEVIDHKCAEVSLYTYAPILQIDILRDSCKIDIQWVPPHPIQDMQHWVM